MSSTRTNEHVPEHVLISGQERLEMRLVEWESARKEAILAHERAVRMIQSTERELGEIRGELFLRTHEKAQAIADAAETGAGKL